METRNIRFSRNANNYFVYLFYISFLRWTILWVRGSRRLPRPRHLQRGARERRLRRPLRPEAERDGAGAGVGAAVQ